jgi:hypothetical protein
MISESIARFEFLCETIPGLLESFDEKSFPNKPSTLKWSKKQILGHLIDSATNNHQRFVRGQFENCPVIFYDQNCWNQYNYYQAIDTRQLINFWKVYNRQICELIKLIPTENLSLKCKSKEGDEQTIEFLFIDYLVHLEHHLQQIINY